LAALLVDLEVYSVAFEAGHVSVADHLRWQEKAPDIQWVAAEGVIERLRMVKAEAEIEKIRRSAGLADEALESVLKSLYPGTSERAIAWELETYMRTHGAQAAAFDIIVASGPRGAMPHAVPSDRLIRAREPVVIDMGAVIDGYRSDLTRTVWLGQPDERYWEVHDVVLQAQLAAETALRPGMSGREADPRRAGVISQAGFGERFQHSLGHGVGLAIHEGPRLSKDSNDVLEAGMVVTVEPGIYLPGWGGVRIEDLVVITADGCELLTRIDKEWVFRDRQ